jgi:transcription-repair coupling factor (superfamily II helicase)
MNSLPIRPTDPSIVELAEHARAGRRVLAQGSQGSSASFVAGALSVRLRRPVVLVVAHLDDADESVEELAAAGVDAVRFPALELMPGETGVSVELFGERLGVVRRALALAEGDAPVIVCPVQALMQTIPAPAAIETFSRRLRVGEDHAQGELVRWLESAGYQRLESIEEPGDFAVRGGIIDVFPPGSATPGAGGDANDAAPGTPVRLDFFGDTLERVAEIDIETMAADRAVKGVELVSASLQAAQADAANVSFLDVLSRGCVAVLHETLEVTEQARGYFERVLDARGVIPPPMVLKALQERFTLVELNQFSGARLSGEGDVQLPVAPLPSLPGDAGEAIKELAEIARSTRVRVFCQTGGELQRLGELLDEFAPGAKERIESVVQYLHRGFIWGGVEDRGSFFLPYHELLHRFESRRRTRQRLKAARAIDTFLDFGVDDYVVHRDHGIARFTGLRVMPARQLNRTDMEEVEASLPGKKPKHKRKSAGKPTRDEHWGMEEFLTLEFAKGAKLHVPATKIDQVQKYVGGFRGKPQLSALGGERWRKQKESVKESVRDLAAELLRVRAAREHMPGVQYPGDTAWQKEFEAEFAFDETEDQLAAIAEIKRDMQSARPMDRLVCGDVGFGKTELAVRAAFKAAEFGRQVAVLVPTTVLAEQHERTFRSRFADYPFKVESLSRFKTTAEINDVLARLRKGQVDVVIGTHRLLSKDVKFADLGLVIVDEEQRFGVEHKERLLALRMTVDVLTLSATPIPRTLHMSMLGLRDISSLSTPPMDRRAVVTEVIPFNRRRIQAAIARELARDGQVFFVHNRVHNIQSVADDIFKLVMDSGATTPPKIVVGHGQMPDKELEQVMLAFMRRDADILVSTTIIESGIDIPTANTMIINDADRFGLSDLHQLRGRVGRYKHRAYCYLLLPENRPVGEVAVKRLKAIEEFSMLGAGFKIAMRDLEIRGAGNILGPEQSGHIAAVGYEMYCQLLDRAVKELKHEVVVVPSETSLEIGVTGLIPKAYIPSDGRRMDAYRRTSLASSPAELERLRAELTGAYGAIPAPVERLLQLAELRIGANTLEVRSITVREKDVILRAPPTRADEAAERLRAASGNVVLLPPKKGEHSSEIYYRPPENYLEPGTLLNVLRTRLAPVPP